ncbi:hypothetical protein EI534_11990 [Pseudomonas frederiksbergensis]|nr:hypothetical protein [Pseudomonas frederiksbergensis]
MPLKGSWITWAFNRTTQKPVGASLLAIAVDQSAEMLNVKPSSRAGSLPHWFQGVTKNAIPPRQIDPIDKRNGSCRAFCVAL